MAGRRPSNAVALGDWSDLYNEFLASERGVEVMEGTSGPLLSARGPTFELSMADLSGTSAPAANRASQLGVGAGPTSGASAFIAEVVADELVDEAEAVEAELLRRLGDEPPAPSSVPNTGWPPQHYAALQQPGQAGRMSAGLRSSGPAPLPPNLARPQPFSTPTAVGVPGSLAVSRQAWQAPASVPTKGQAGIGAGYHVPPSQRDSVLRASVPAAAYGAATGIPQGWVPGYGYGHGDAASSGMVPEPTTALRQAMGMRNIPVRTSAPAPLGGRPGARRDVSPGSMSRPSRGQPSSYAALHTQRQNSPPHSRGIGIIVGNSAGGTVGGGGGGVGVVGPGVGSSVDREEMFEALHRGLSPHRLRALYLPPGTDGAAGPGAFGRRESGPGGSYVTASAQQQQQYPPYQNPLQRIENWAAAAAARSAVPQPAMYMTAAGPRASPLRQSAPMAGGDATSAQRGGEQYMTAAATAQASRGPQGQGVAGMDLRASAPSLAPRQAAAQAGGRAGSPTGVYRPPVPRPTPASAVAASAQARRATSPSWNEAPARRSLQHPASVSAAATAGSSTASTVTGNHRPSQPMQSPLPPQPYLHPHPQLLSAAGAADGSSTMPAGEPAAVGAAEPLLLEQLARRTPSPVEPRSPGLFISPQAYREYAAASTTRAGRQQQPGLQPATAPAAQAPSAGMTPVHGGEAAGLEAGGFTAHGIRGMQRRLAAGLEEAAVERDRDGQGAARRSPGRERDFAGAAFTGAAASPVATLRPPDIYDDGVMQPRTASPYISTASNDMSAALEGGASPYTLAAAAAAAALAAAQRSDAMAARQRTRSSGGGAVGSGSLFESPSFGGTGLVPTAPAFGGVAASAGVAPVSLVAKGVADLDQAGLEALDAEFEFYEAITASRQGTQGGFDSLPGAAAAAAAATPGGGVGTRAARAGARAFGGAGGAGAVRASWPSPTHQSPGAASALPSNAAATAAAANGAGGRSMVASSVSSATWRAHGAGAPTTAASLQGAVGARGSTSAGGSSAVAGGGAPGNAAPGVSGMSASALSAAAAAVVATALQHTRSSSMSDNGASGGGGVGGSALTPGPSAVLDTAALTAQLSRLDAASLEAIRGYASGYIDGRVQAMPQYGQVRSQVVKAAVLRLVDEALAARHAGDPSSQPQPQPLQVAADASRHVVAPRTGANPIKPASAGAALAFLPTTVPAPADRASPGEERLPAVDLDLDQPARCLPRHSPSDGSSAPVPPRPAPAYMSSSTRAGVAATLLPGNASETGSSVDSSPLHGSGGRRASGSRGISSPKSSALVTEASRSSGGRRKRVSWHSNFDGPPGTLPSSAGADGADAAAAAATGSGASAVDLIAAAAAAAVAAERASLEEAGMLTRAADAPPASDVVATGLGQAAATTPGAAAPTAGVVATGVSTMESRFQVPDGVQHDGSEHSPFSAAKGQPAFEYDDDQPRAPGPRPEPPQRRLSLAERIAAQLSDETPVAEGSAPPIGTDAAGQVNEPVSTAGADTAGADTAAGSGSAATDGTQQETGALASAAAVMARAQLHDALAQRQRPDVAAATGIAAVASMTSSEEEQAHGAPVGANVPTIAARPVAVAADEAAATASDGAVIIPTLLDAPREMVTVAESPIAVAAASSVNESPAPKASPATACAPPLRAEAVGAGDGEPAVAATQHPEQSCAVGAVDGERVKDLAADATTVAATAAAAAAASASAEAFAAGSAADAVPVVASSAYKEATAVSASQQQAPSANSTSDGPGTAAAGHHRPLATSSSADGYLTRSPGSTGDGSDPGATPGLPARASTSSGSGAAPGTASVSVSVPVPMPGTAKANARTGQHTPGVTGLNVGGGVSARKLGASPPGYQPQTHMQSSGGVTSPGVRMSTSSPTTAASNASTLGAATARGGATAGGASGGGIVLSRPAGPTFTSPPQSPASMRPSKLQALSSGFSARAVQSSGGAAPRHAAPGAGNTSFSSLSSGGAGPHPYQPTSLAPHSISNKIMSIVSPTASGSGHHPVRSASRGGRDVGQATSAITGATGTVLSEQLRHDSLKFVRQLEAAIAEQAAEAGQSEAQSAQAAIRGAELEEQAEEQALKADAVQAPVAAQQEAAAVVSPAEAAVEFPEVQAVGNAVHAAPKREEQGNLSATAESATGTALVQPASPEAAASEKAPDQKQGLAASVEAPQAIASSSAAATAAAVPSAAENGKMGLEALHTPHGEPPAAVATDAHVKATAVAAAAPFAADAAVQAAAGAVATEQASATTEHVRSEAATTAPAAAVEVSKEAPAPPPAAEPAAARTTEVAVASAPASVPGSSRSADAAPSVAPAAQAPEKGHAEAAEPSKPEPEVPVAPPATAAPAVAAAAPTSPAVAPVQQPGPQPGGAGGTTSAAQGSPGASSPARGGAPRGVTLTHWRGSAGGGSPTKTASSAAAAVGASSDAAGPPAPEVSSLSALAAPAAAASATTLPPTAPLVPETAAAAAVTSSEQLKPTAVDKEVEPVTPPAPTPAEAPKPGAVGALPGLQAAVQAERQSAKGALPEPPAALQEVELPAGAAIGPTQSTALTVVSPGPAAPTVTAAPAELVRDTATSAQPAAATPTSPTPSAAENVAAGAQPAPAAPMQAADGGAPMAPAGEVASASAAATTEAPATEEAPVAGGYRLKLSPSLNSVVSAADTPDGSGTTTPTQRRSGRDARSIEPVLAELKTVKSAIAAGDPGGSSTARMTELLEQLDSYRRGVERKHGPSHSIATQLRILHADMSKWLRSNTANTAAVPGAAGPGAAGSAHTNAGSGVVAAAAAAHGAVRTGSAGGSSTAARGAPPALEAVPEAAAAEQRPLPAQQAQLDQPGQQWAGAGSVGRRESQSSVNTDATFDTAGGGTAASTPRDSIADGGGGFSFPSHHASSEQPRGSAGGFNALPQPGRPSGSGLAGMQQPGNNGGAVNRGMGGVGGTATGNMGGMGTGGMPLSAGPGHQGMGSHVSFAAMGMAGAGAMGQGGTGIGAGGMGMGPGGSTGIGMGLYGAGGGMAQPGVGGIGHMGMAGAGMMQPGMHGTHAVGMAGMMQPGAGMMQPGAAGGGMGGGMSLMELANQLNSMTMQQQASHGPTQSAVFMPAGMRATMSSRTSEISAAAAATAVTAVQRTASASAQAEALQQSQSQKKPKSKWSTLFGKK